MPRFGLSIIGLVVLALVITACGDTPPPSASVDPDASPAAESPAESSAESEAPSSEAPSSGEGRLADVQARGQLICGVNGALPGFSFLDEASGEYSGFDVDFCRALAAAVLGDPELVEFRDVATDQRGPLLQSGDIDVLIRNTTWTVSRDTSWGLFGPTTFYDGQAIMVNSTLTDATTIDELAGATICVQSGTTTELNLTDRLGDTITPQVFPEIDPTYTAYEEGRCDAVTSDRSQLVARRTAFENPDDHLILEEVMSKEPLGPVAPLGDDQWFNVVKWTVYATIEAEEQGITQANVADMAATSENPVVLRLLGQTVPDTDPFDSGLGLDPEWVIDVISAVGNYGEIYERNLGAGTPFELERGLNALWTDQGLLYAPPYR
ncbi:MAG TPA: amino acid ABC transporter substrate-binding protein [Candidatus Limnocylindrales bacterium]|nr:amino acid ABC transporter substrate-binding protein [Candidatus Limnocylindrales bacterium]